MIASGFRVGSLGVRVVGDDDGSDGAFRPRGEADLVLETSMSKAPLRPPGSAIAEGDTWAAFREENRLVFVAKNPLRTPQEVARIDLLPEAGQATLHTAPDLDTNPLVYPLDQLLTIHLLRRRSGLLLHAACVANDRVGFVVAGPSGAGKTTLARAAASLPGARVLTDERVVVRPDAGGWLADGTPWSGEGLFARDETVPLGAIYLLEKSDRDEIEAISPVRAIALLLRCHFPATWVDSVEDQQLAALERLVHEVPCYRLRTRLGGSAHELVLGSSASHTLSSTAGRGAVIRRLLADGLHARFTAYGSSMGSAIRSGDELTVEPIGEAELQIDDIAVVDMRGSLVVHRVRGLDPLRLRGDALAASDPPVDGSAVLGRVIAIAPGPDGRGAARLLRRVSRLIRAGVASLKPQTLSD